MGHTRIATLLFFAALLLALLVGPVAPIAAQEAVPAAVTDALHAAPVHFTGRVMPLERASRIVVRRFSGSRRIEGHDQNDWLVRLILRPFSAIHDKAFLVDDPGALDAIGFPNAGRARYSYAELYPFLPAVDSFAAALESVDRPLDATERAIVSLSAKVALFEGLASTLDVFRAAEGASEYEQWLAGHPQVPDAAVVRGMLRLIPPAGDRQDSPEWLTPAHVIGATDVTPGNELLEAWNRLAKEPTATNAERIVPLSRTTSLSRRARTALSAEVIYLAISPRVLTLGLSALLLVLVAVLGKFEKSRAVVAGLMLLVLSIEQILRILITGRPPVVTLGGALLFFGWAVSLVITVRTFRDALRSRRSTRAHAAVARTLTAAVFPVVAVGVLVESSADPFAVVQAVLDTNLWLTVHIGTIAAGYLSVIAAACLAEWYLLREQRRPDLWERNRRWYRRARLAALVGLTFTTLGTLLGGFWADQSWGRFWGWDPKESGALLIILWLSLVLHLRQTTRRSRAVVAAGLVLGLGVLLFAWVGVNALGIGLHSYGLVTGSLVAVLAAIVLIAALAVSSLVLATRGRSEPPLH